MGIGSFREGSGTMSCAAAGSAAEGQPTEVHRRDVMQSEPFRQSPTPQLMNSRGPQSPKRRNSEI